MAGTRRLAATLGAVLALACPLSARAAHARTFDYLHVEADSGASSGGHAAIRFGDETYHFVYAEPGILRAVRDRSDEFEYVYRAYDNRGIDVVRVEVSDATYAALRRAFLTRQLTQDAHLEALDSAGRDRAVLDALALSIDGASWRELGHTAVLLKGAGYFIRSPDADASASARSRWVTSLEHAGGTALTGLRDTVEGALGAGFIERARTEIDREIRSLAYACVASPRLVAGRMPAVEPAFADRYRDLLLIRLALDVLRHGRPPVASAFRTSSHPWFALDGEEVAALRARASHARRDLVRLVTSSRRDRGFPLLVGMARLVALEASIALQRLVVPDTFADDRNAISGNEVRGSENAARAVLLEKSKAVEEAKQTVTKTDEANEIAWSALELAANVYIELERGLTKAAAIRIDTSAVPARTADLDPEWPRPAADPANLERWRECATATQRRRREDVTRLYGYDLISRNCVTEIFTTIDGAFADSVADGPDDAIAASSAALGGHFDAERGLNFVPFVSAATVDRTYRVRDRFRLPSYRAYWLDRMLRGPRPLATRLRESNVISSRLYQRGGSDDVFLFFTDDTPALRPLLGLANMAVGAGAAAAGLLALPLDGGALALGGLRGMLFSTPELAFVNIRKGSNALVPNDWTDRLPYPDALP